MSIGSKSESPESPRSQSVGDLSSSPKAIKVCVIGNIGRREFESIQRMLLQEKQWQIHRRFNDIQEAVKEADVIQQADLTIVLQSWSEQFARRDIHQLIGMTFTKQLICFCGPWCESDGRNHDLWPDAIRLPAREAAACLTKVRADLVAETEALPPTAAKDEVFASRVPANLDPKILQKLALTNAAVIGPDASLRRTMANVLKSISVRTAVRNLITVVPYQTIVPVQTPRGPIHVVFHDLDPYGAHVQQSIEACEQMFPEAKVVGIANMPDAGLVGEIADLDLDGVLAKSNLLADVQHWLATEQ